MGFVLHGGKKGDAARSRIAIVLAAAAAIGALAPADAAAKELVSPYGLFIEGGAGDDSSRSIVVGAAWTWVQPSRWGAGNASGYLETSIGEWACHKTADGHYKTCSTQVGLTPVIRYQPESWTHVFMEIGIGADAIFPAYRTDKRAFATEFNFGDHLGLGYKFGEDLANEVELRVEHYSNGGYKNPNPGENWAQVRYMRWF